MTQNTKWSVPKGWEDAYKLAIQEVLSSEKKFNIFRQDLRYNIIVPNDVPMSEANTLFNKLIEYPDIINKFNIIKKMDQIGSPELYQPWNTSPRNFKYMYATARIIKSFGKEIRNVVEIGVGYGGLCYTMMQYFNLVGYKLVDIDCVIELTKKFLSKLTEKNDCFYNSNSPYDLGVSECAITELSDSSIQYYYYKYFLQCQHLFIRTNFQNPGRLNWFIDLIQNDFTVKMEPDLPNEEEKTVLFGWKNND